MFAVIRTGGKQYKVQQNQVILVEKLEKEVGKDVKITEVLMIGSEKTSEVGTPLLDKVEVVAKVEDQIKDKKVLVFKKKRRQNYRRKKGHRQLKTVLRVTDILKDGKSLLGDVKKAAPKVTAKAEEKSEKGAEKKASPSQKDAEKKPSEKKPATKKTETEK